MATLSSAKTLGGVGSILLLLAPLILLLLAPAGLVLLIAGVVLILVAIKRIGGIVGDASMFRNMLIAVVLAVVGFIVVVITVLAAVLQALGLGMLSGGVFVPQTTLPANGLLGLITGVLVGLAVVWVLLIVSACFVRMSYKSVATKLGVGMFGTAGLLYLIGAALTIILVGLVLMFVAVILNIVAFFSIPDQLPTQQPSPPPAAPTPLSP